MIMKHLQYSSNKGYKSRNQSNMEFKASFCDPFKADTIELGPIQKDAVIEKFKSIPWKDYLNQMEKAKENEIHHSPSLGIENIINKNAVEISAVEEDRNGNIEFYIFYKRPKLVKKFFGLKESMNENYLTDALGQTENDAIDCLAALINNDLDFLEKKVK